MEAQTVNLNRDDLAAFIKDPRTIRAFENLGANQDSVVQSVTDILASPLISLTGADAFSANRILAGSSDILLTDGGAKANITIGMAPTGVSAGAYGSQTQIPRFQVDNKGRLTLAAQFELNSTFMTEGTNFFFTTARARSAISGSSTVTYNSSSGSISLTNANVVAALGFTPQQQSTYLNAISGTVPAADGTYANPTSITIVNGIITAIS